MRLILFRRSIGKILLDKEISDKTGLPFQLTRPREGGSFSILYKRGFIPA